MPKVDSKTKRVDALLSEKYCRRLVTCSFDETFLQQPNGFLAAISARLNGENPNNGKAMCAKLPDWVSNPPPLIRPVAPRTHGLDGQVPLDFSITWQRHTPSAESSGTVELISTEEPDVLLIVLQRQLNSLIEKESEVRDFILTLRSLPQWRRISLILFSSRLPSTKDHSLMDFITRLQLEGHLTGIQQASTVQNLAILVANYSKAICQRPFKQFRLETRHGFSFLPASATTVAGAVPAPRFPSSKMGGGSRIDDKEAVRAWVRRTWLRQLATWRGMTGEVVNAVAGAYATPRALFNALRDTSNPEDGNGDTLTRLAELPIRRGAGVLATETRLGKAMAVRIATFFTSMDPDLIDPCKLSPIKP